MRVVETRLPVGVVALGAAVIALATLAPARARAAGPDAAQPDVAASFMACSALAEVHAADRGLAAADQEFWESKRRLFFAAAAAYAAPAELERLVLEAGRGYERWEAQNAGDPEGLQRALAACTARAVERMAPLEARWAAQRREAWEQATRLGLVIGARGLRYVHRRSDGSRHEYSPAGPADRDLWTPWLAPTPLPRREPPWTRRLTLTVDEEATDAEGLARFLASTMAEARRTGRLLRSTTRPHGNDPAEHLLWAVSRRTGATDCAYLRVALQDGQGLAVVSTVRLPGELSDDAARGWLAEHAAEEEAALALREGPPSVAILQNVQRVRSELAMLPLQVFARAPVISAAE